MTEREAFIASIAADPADDTARLAFADWLQERGEETRAEFIRLQCEIARRPFVPNDANRERANELLQRNWPEWYADLFAALAMPAPGPRTRPKQSWKPWRYGPYALDEDECEPQSILRVQFANEFDRRTGQPLPNRQRGFLGSLHFDRGLVARFHVNLANRGEGASLGAALALEPVVALSIQLATESAHWRAISHPALNRLRELTLWLPYPAEDQSAFAPTVEAVLNDTNLSGVRTLELYGSTASAEYEGYDPYTASAELVARAIGSRVGGAAERLSLHVGRAGVLAFANAEMLPNLRALDLNMNELERDDLAAFALPQYRERLEELNLSQNSVNGAALAAGRPWARLRALVFSYAALGTDEWAALGRPESFPALAKLGLAHSYLPDLDALMDALGAGGFPALAVLDVSGCNLTEANALALAEVVARTNVRELNLCNNWRIYRDTNTRIRELLGDRVKLDPAHDPPDPNDPNDAIPF